MNIKGRKLNSPNVEIFRMVRDYTVLFQSRVQALNQLFCVIGNGYDWVDGCLVDKFHPSPAEKKARRIRDEEGKKQWDELVEKIPELMTTDLYRKRKEEEEKIFTALQSLGSIAHGSVAIAPDDYRFYPICELSYIVAYPPNIRADWEEARRETIQAILQSKDEVAKEALRKYKIV